VFLLGRMALLICGLTGTERGHRPGVVAVSAGPGRQRTDRQPARRL